MHKFVLRHNEALVKTKDKTGIVELNQDEFLKRCATAHIDGNKALAAALAGKTIVYQENGISVSMEKAPEVHSAN